MTHNDSPMSGAPRPKNGRSGAKQQALRPSRSSEQTYYRVEEAADLLQVSENALRTWLKKAGIEPEVDPQIQRRKRITRRDLVRIARLHGRALPPVGTPAQPASPMTLERVAQMQEELSTRLDQLTELVEKLTKRFAESE